mmetsp:Transcript_42333/g.90053  ORF Transcript_42333/g.90053 Transcript_42333/m.90053 type:complete len:391 (-) Transcript_42333:128-1300(-)|eukprot:CAMPEP_0172554926 /NCGR_PEP_ID=MMETSP1067-20121228/57066_1 /TAXON_ID=265564 ORGANISM="Thalassiosira punctigera, Strain Tpunct2005C2" /NCGR_SAMPLE_ID=MMETSP1067 /ASSEMBLY_ACC=CAM_ASM_000444 /LENGTH=390 /DNA_ID=CAMNT_0013343403 /DNA_START=37 /DNA_END=1209 /DNA_ORIENTATION=-
MADASIVERLADPSRPVFLLGDVPPGEGTPPGKCQQIADKFLQRSRVLASDGFIVYDIQDEPGRSDVDRPFPFRRVMDSSAHAAMLARSSGRECLVYKCVADTDFDGWLQRAQKNHGHSAINVVGRASSEDKYEGPTISEAMEKVNSTENMHFGCVCIAERHTLEAAEARGKTYPTEHLNMLRKQRAGAEWFVSQAVYDAEPTVRLLRDYAAVCKRDGVAPRKVVLTFAPVSRSKTMKFLKWLGVRVPREAEESILNADKPAERSVEFLCDILRRILAECVGVGVPLGISCESVSIFKSEIDACHTLFRRLQEILLDTRGSPWNVQWIEVMPCDRWTAPMTDRSDVEKDKITASVANNGPYDLVKAGFVGVVLGGAIASFGVVLGGSKRR